MAAPAAAAAAAAAVNVNCKRPREDDDEKKPATSEAKRVKSLDEEEEVEEDEDDDEREFNDDVNLEEQSDMVFWKEPRSVVDMEFVVKFPSGCTVTAHVHRLKLMEHSKVLEIAIPAMEEGCRTLTYASGPFKCNRDVKLFFNYVYFDWTSSNTVNLHESCTTASFLRMFEVFNHFDCPKSLKVYRGTPLSHPVIAMLPMKERIHLATTYAWEELNVSAVDHLLAAERKSTRSFLRANPTCASAVAPAMINRLHDVKATIDQYFRSCISNSRRDKSMCIDRPNCKCVDGKHKIDFSLCSLADFSFSAYPLLLTLYKQTRGLLLATEEKEEEEEEEEA